jgi:hypothetical protein
MSVYNNLTPITRKDDLPDKLVRILTCLTQLKRDVAALPLKILYLSFSLYNITYNYS